MAPQQPAWVRPFDRLDLTGADATGVYRDHGGRDAAVQAARARGISGRHVIPAVVVPWGRPYVFLFGRGRARNSALLAADDPAAPPVEVLLDACSFSYSNPVPIRDMVVISETVERDYATGTFPAAMATALIEVWKARRGRGKDVFTLTRSRQMRMDSLQRLVTGPLRGFLADFPPGSTGERQECGRLLGERAIGDGPLTTDVMYLARTLAATLSLIDEALQARTPGVPVRDLDEALTDTLDGAWRLRYSPQERLEMIERG